MGQRQDDAAGLRDLLRSDELTDQEREAFADMENGLIHHRALTERQREWVTRVCDRLGIVYGNPTERNKSVPRGRDVPLLPVQKMLPKKPPRRIGA